MKKYSQHYLSTTFSLALAAVVAVSAAGCTGNAEKNSGNAAAPSTASAAATITAHIPTGSSADHDSVGIGASIREDTSGTAATASADSAGSLSGTAENIKDETASSSLTAGSPDSVESGNETAAMGITAGKTAGIGGPGASLKESDLMEALTECTGWGTSAGSSLRAATAAVLLLQWANDTDAGNVDTALLTSTIREKTGELSDTQLQDLKDNWSTISFDADQILNNLEEIRVLTEDAGCAEAAKDAASHKNAAANWKAVSQALDNILK